MRWANTYLQTQSKHCYVRSRDSRNYRISMFVPTLFTFVSCGWQSQRSRKSLALDETRGEEEERETQEQNQ